MKTKGTIILAFLLSHAIDAFATTRYVDLNNPAPTPPYTEWNTASTNLQDAIDVAAAGDLILVTNGIYSTGGRVVYGDLTNRVVLDKAVTLQSVNGPDVTLIVGNSPIGPTAVRCVYLTNGASLSGFTLTNGAVLTSYYGGDQSTLRINNSGAGVWCEDSSAIVTNCNLVNNSAEYGFGGMGGGSLSGTLINCLLTGNKAVSGGGAAESVLMNCVLSNNQAVSSVALTGGSSITSYGGGAHYSSFTNCIIVGNHSDGFGGGVSKGTLQSCTIDGNSAGSGGGLYGSTCFDGSISKNSARVSGGATYTGTLINSIVSGNVAANGGGTYLGSASNVRIFDNLALAAGGGAYRTTLNNSALLNNSAITNGGGVFGGVLNNCTLAGNTSFSGGGVFSGEGAASALLTNCIVYFNYATTGSNYAGGTLDHCCTTPLSADGEGNIITAPMLADGFHLNAVSPCFAAGTATAISGVDMDGDAWLNPPSIGCDEYDPSSLNGPLDVKIRSDYANANPGAEIRFTAAITGNASFSIWNFGDGTTLTNQPYTSYAWSSVGDYLITLVAYNSDHPEGVTNSIIIHVAENPVLYVAQGTQVPVAPYLTWATAATNIQDAVDAAFAGGSTVLVSNGVYRTGGRAITGVLTNRVCVGKPVQIQSVNGPGDTVIEGYQLPVGMPTYQTFFPNSRVGDSAVRCVYLCDGASLDGFTLTNGATRSGFNSITAIELSGGGVFCQSTNATLSNCIIVSNACNLWGAGAFSGTLANCQVSSNFNFNKSLGGGGGVAFSAVFDSTLSGNTTGVPGGGGAANSSLSNCVVTLNSDGVANSSLDHCNITGNTSVGMYGGVAFDSIISSNNSTISGFAGGATSATLSNCLVIANRAMNGGGVYNCVLSFCTISNNYATNQGGGIYWAIPFPNPSPAGYSNIVIGNIAGGNGGGFYSVSGTDSLTNWIFIGNAASGDGGGYFAASGTRSFYDCLFAENTATGNGAGLEAALGANVSCLDSIFSNNIALLNGGGANNISLKNCVFSGNEALNGGGCYGGTVANSTFQNNSANLNGGGGFLNSSAVTNCNFTANSAANCGGLYFGGGIVSNCLFTLNSARTNGGGLYLGSFSNVRDSSFSENRAVIGGAGYNGNYWNCLLNGNTATNTAGAVFCQLPSSSSNCVFTGNVAYTNGGAVSGGNWTLCQLTGNHAGQKGGGAYNSVLSKSYITDNSALMGGGVYYGSLNQCVLTRNRAQTGGAAYNSNNYPVNNCTIVGNFGTNNVGGVYGTAAAAIVSSIVYFNSSPASSNYFGTANSYCCLYPLPPGGTGNITNNPLLIDLAGENFRLQTNSPCINAGGGSPGITDLDGRPRLVGGRIDIGAYEFQGAGMGEFIAWLQYNGLPTSGADYLDSDNDRLNNWQEWIAGTNPTNSSSLLQMLSPVPAPSGMEISWQSVSAKYYFLQRSTNLTEQLSFSTIQSNLLGQPDLTSFFDATAPADHPCYYRIGIQ